MTGGRWVWLILSFLSLASAEARQGSSSFRGCYEGGSLLNLTSVSRQTQSLPCVQSYQENKCEEFKRNLPPEEQDKILNCQDQHARSVGSLVLACKDGMGQFVIDSATGVVHLLSQLPYLPGAAWKQLVLSGEFVQKCNSDAEFRKSIFKPIAPLYSVMEQESLLKTLPCEGLIQMVRQQTQNASQDIASKRKLQAKFRGQFPDGVFPERIQLTPGEVEFLQFQAKQADLVKARLNQAIQRIWTQVQGQMQCYTSKAQVEAVCAVLSEIALEVGTGGLVAGLRHARRVGSVSKMNQVVQQAAEAVPSSERSLLKAELIPAPPRLSVIKTDLGKGLTHTQAHELPAHLETNMAKMIQNLKAIPRNLPADQLLVEYRQILKEGGYRARNQTSFYPPGLNAEKILSAIDDEKLMKVAMPEGSNGEKYVFNSAGVRYEAIVCGKPPCKVEGKIVNKVGELLTLVPICGQGVRGIKSAKMLSLELIEKGVPENIPDYLAHVPCSP